MRIGVIGGGSMGEALVSAWLAKGIVKPLEESVFALLSLIPWHGHAP